MKKNADGGVTLYVGPGAPARPRGELDTDPRKTPPSGMLFYGPTEVFRNKTFKMPDFEMMT